MVKLDDLSPEDKIRLLEEAKELVDKENIRKHALVMYGCKKKELTESYLKHLYKEFNIQSVAEENILKQKYSAMVNYLYKMAVKKRYHSNNLKAISTEEEWNIYQDVSEQTKNMMIEIAYKYIGKRRKK